VVAVGAPSPWRREVPGQPAAFRPAAGEIAAAAVWLGAPARCEDDLVLAVHELLVNAWEHGHRRALDPPIRIEVARDPDGAVSVRVADAARGGRWQPDAPPVIADPGAGRGRGLAIVRALAGEVAVAADTDGTAVTLTLPCGGAGC
jgi:anti-sigma regulatory factor (Ser/Thr protein kinase)